MQPAAGGEDETSPRRSRLAVASALLGLLGWLLAAPAYAVAIKLNHFGEQEERSLQEHFALRYAHERAELAERAAGARGDLNVAKALRAEQQTPSGSDARARERVEGEIARSRAALAEVERKLEALEAQRAMYDARPFPPPPRGAIVLPCLGVLHLLALALGIAGWLRTAPGGRAGRRWAVTGLLSAGAFAAALVVGRLAA